MQITRAGEYGILGAMYLAKQPSHRLVMIEEISSSENIPRSFLAKIVQSLAHAGLVESHRGVGGGFRLARPANRISVLEILQAIEGTVALQTCTDNPALCVWDASRMQTCSLCALFNEAQLRVTGLFSQTTLADLIKPRETLVHAMNGQTVSSASCTPDPAPAVQPEPSAN